MSAKTRAACPLAAEKVLGSVPVQVHDPSRYSKAIEWQALLESGEVANKAARTRYRV